MSVLPGTFTALARNLLVRDPSTDNIGELTDALMFGASEWDALDASLRATKRTAVDPIVTDDAANAATANVADLQPRFDRLQSAYDALDMRLSVAIRRQREADAAERQATVEAASRARCADAVVAFNDRYDALADELADLVVECSAAGQEAAQLGLDRNIAPRVVIPCFDRVAALLRLPSNDMMAEDRLLHSPLSGAVERVGR